MYNLICVAVSLAVSLLDTTIMTVFCDRGVAHGAVAPRPGIRWSAADHHLAARLIFGEGYQNNHHRYPASEKSADQSWEVDLGFGVALLLEKLAVLEIQRALLLRSATASTDGLAHE